MSRAYCYRCYRPEVSCICQWTQLIDSPLKIIILQHPDEVKHPKGSAIIAKLCLQNIDIFIGEDFSTDTKLNKILQENPQTIALVFPSENAEDFIEAQSKMQTISHLIFIDATWRKAKKIFFSSKNLHQLRRVKLPTNLHSNYRIRKAPKDDFVSTIEAIHYCLNTLHNEGDYKILLDIFKKMVDAQVEHRCGSQI